MPKTTAQWIQAANAANVNLFIWGPPGVGKTEMIKALAQEAGAHLETLIGSTLDPAEVGGFLVATPDGVKWTPPPWGLRLRAALDRHQPAWLFADELSSAPRSVHAALLRVLQERQVGALDLSGCRMIAASNPPDTAADGGDLSAAMSNRWAQVQFHLDPAAWISGTLRGWNHGWSSAEARVAASVAGWIGRSPEALLKVPNFEQMSAPWPSPRSWTNGIRFVAAANTPEAMAYCVGDAAASEWTTWQAAQDLPLPEDVLRDFAKLPNRGDQRHVTLLAVVAYALQAGGDTINQCWALLQTVRPDQAIAGGRALIEATGEIPDVARDLGARIIAAR